MSTFKVGEKVVCINPIYNLIKNDIYEISKIQQCKCGIVNIELNGIKKQDIKGVYDNTICECGIIYYDCPDYFKSTRFRKLDYQFGHDICAELSRQYNEDFVEL